MQVTKTKPSVAAHSSHSLPDVEPPHLFSHNRRIHSSIGIYVRNVTVRTKTNSREQIAHTVPGQLVSALRVSPRILALHCIQVLRLRRRLGRRLPPHASPRRENIEGVANEGVSEEEQGQGRHSGEVLQKKAPNSLHPQKARLNLLAV